ncbi:MAG TPA: lipopolysaccharide transport periplasmic protein LptA [Mariprofundaceae bacterium]|nr:lipopolysaccharide transport periplasmic protein LptA [Mariprofundaceae bacterium]
MATTRTLIRLCCAGFVLAALITPLTGRADPVEIQAKTMELDHAKAVVTFEKDVRLVQGDFELRCDKLVGHYEGSAGNKTADNPTELQHAEAYGHVTMRHGTTTGSADEAQLDNDKGKLTLIGHAVVEQEGRRIEGNSIVHDLRRQDTAVSSTGDSRVRMNIESGDENKALIPSASELPAP